MKRLQLLALFIVLGCLGFRANAQCPYAPSFCDCGHITMPADQLICPGSTYVHDFTPDIYLPPGFTLLYWAWTPPTGVAPGGGSYPATPGLTSFTPATTTTYSLEVDAAGPNIINDGDFASWSLGTPCFNSAYTYTTSSGFIFFPSHYSILTSSAPAGVPGLADHSSTMPGPPPGPYNMLIANGQTGIPVWEENQIPVCSDADYVFNFWLANVLGSGPSDEALIRVVIGGVTYGPFQATGPLSWQAQTMTYHSPVGGGMISIDIYDDQKVFNQADGFALDDISFNLFCKMKGSFTINLGAITGPTTVCEGSTIGLSATPAGGTWSCGPGATIDALGNLTGVTAGPVTVNYVSPGGCIESAVVTVLTTPTISGSGSVCEYDIAYLTGTPSGLVWSYTGPVYPWAGIPGNYWGYLPGIATITYTDPATGCYSNFTLTVNETPPSLPYDYYRCVGDALTLTETPAGGTWTSSNPAAATIDPVTGVVTTLSPGTTLIVYTTPFGCTAFTILHLYDCSGGGVSVGGGGSLCEGSYTTLVGLPTGGTWTSGSPGVASIDPITGYVYAIMGGGGGPVTFTYVSGGVTITTTINIIPAVSACVTADPGPPPGFDFVTGCTGTAYVHYVVYDFTGMPVGYPWGYTATVTGGFLFIPLTTIQSLPYGSYWTTVRAGKVCVTGVECESCYFPAYCCASFNMPGHKSSNGSAGGPEAAESSLIIEPNPNNGAFTLTGIPEGMTNATEARIEIMDMIGRTVYSDVAAIDNGAIHKNITLGADVTNGLYIIKVHDGNSSQVMRFVLNR